MVLWQAHPSFFDDDDNFHSIVSSTQWNPDCERVCIDHGDTPGVTTTAVNTCIAACKTQADAQSAYDNMGAAAAAAAAAAASYDYSSALRGSSTGVVIYVVVGVLVMCCCCVGGCVGVYYYANSRRTDNVFAQANGSFANPQFARSANNAENDNGGHSEAEISIDVGSYKATASYGFGNESAIPGPTHSGSHNAIQNATYEEFDEPSDGGSSEDEEV